MRRYNLLSKGSALLQGPGRAESGDPPSADESFNAGLLRLEAVFASLAYGGLQSFYALYAIQLGASNALVGWLTSGPALLNLLWFIPCGRLVQKCSDYRRPLVIGLLAHRCMLVSFALIPFLPPVWRAWGFVALVTAIAVPTAVVVLSYQAAWGEMFAQSRLARMVGQRWAVANVVSIIGVPVMGRFLDLVRFPVSFQALFAGVGLLTVAAAVIARSHRLPARVVAPAPVFPGGGWLELAKEMWTRHRSFVYYETAALVVYLAWFAAVPLFRIYWVRDLGASGGWIGALAASYAVGATTGTYLWGRWSHPTRNRRYSLIAGLGFLAGYPVLTAMFTTLAPLLGIGLLAGFFGGGFEVLMFNRTMDVSPREQRPTFIAMHNFTSNVAALSAPLLFTLLIESWGTRQVLALAGGLGVMAAVLLYAIGWLNSSAGDGLS